MNNLDINEKLCKILGIDIKNISEVYVHMKPKEMPKVTIVKYLPNVEEPEVTQFRLVPLED